MPVHSAAEWVGLARQALAELIETELAVVSAEIDAKLADEVVPSLGYHIDPHHLSSARTDLLREGKIAPSATATRGGSEVTVWSPVGGRRTTAIAKAAQRKRLLFARYLGWAQGTAKQAGVIGAAAERSVHASLLRSGTFQLTRPEGGNVREFLGVTVPIGALDNAALYVPARPDGTPATPVAVPMEVKNLRDWIYPTSQELYQLLDKAAQLQALRPGVAIAPVLVCRRAHFTTFRMAKAFGFFVIQTKRQYISGVDETNLAEVRNELGFRDLIAGTEADDLVVRRLRDTFPKMATDTAARWKATTANAALCSTFGVLRGPISGRRRRQETDLLRRLAAGAGMGNGW